MRRVVISVGGLPGSLGGLHWELMGKGGGGGKLREPSRWATRWLWAPGGCNPTPPTQARPHLSVTQWRHRLHGGGWALPICLFTLDSGAHCRATDFSKVAALHRSQDISLYILGISSRDSDSSRSRVDLEMLSIFNITTDLWAACSEVSGALRTGACAPSSCTLILEAALQE